MNYWLPAPIWSYFYMSQDNYLSTKITFFVQFSTPFDPFFIAKNNKKKRLFKVAFARKYLIFSVFTFRAVNEARTRDPQLGKLVLYQLSYYRKKLTSYEPIPGLEPGTYSLRMNCSTN